MRCSRALVSTTSTLTNVAPLKTLPPWSAVAYTAIDA
jgi:hypothetical protein